MTVYGRFCKILNADFLSWASFCDDKSTATLIIGSLSVFQGQDFQGPKDVIEVQRLTGRHFMMNTARKNIERDTQASDEFKEAAERALDEVDPIRQRTVASPITIINSERPMTPMSTSSVRIDEMHPETAYWKSTK